MSHILHLCFDYKNLKIKLKCLTLKESILFLKFIYNQSKIALKSCFCSTTMSINYKFTSLPSLLDTPPSHPPSHSSRSSPNMELSPRGIQRFLQQSISHRVVYQCYSLNSSHLLLIRAPKTAQKIKGRLKVMVPLIPAFPRYPQTSLLGAPHQHLHLLRQRSRMGYLAAVSHQAPGRTDWHTESLRLNLRQPF